MLHVTQAEYLGGFRVRLDFNDGFSGVVDLSGRLTGPVFQTLNDVEEFRRFTLVGHTLSWQNGADLAPEYLRELAADQLAEQPHAEGLPFDAPPAEQVDEHAAGWKCSVCGEAVPGNFDVCWNCQTPRGTVDTRLREPESEPPA